MNDSIELEIAITDDDTTQIQSDRLSVVLRNKQV